MMQQMIAVMQELDRDPEVGCFVITGSERAFAAGADIKELASKSYASREHCLIEHLDDRYRLRDLNSVNGTYVNDVRVRETFLRHGDRILIGTMHIEFIQSLWREWLTVGRAMGTTGGVSDRLYCQLIVEKELEYHVYSYMIRQSQLP